MKRQYTITIEEDTDEGTLTFALDMPTGSILDTEDISDMLVQVAEMLYENSSLADASLH
jgi:hypothetical protein